MASQLASAVGVAVGVAVVDVVALGDPSSTVAVAGFVVPGVVTSTVAVAAAVVAVAAVAVAVAVAVAAVAVAVAAAVASSVGGALECPFVARVAVALGVLAGSRPFIVRCGLDGSSTVGSASGSASG